MIVISHRGYWRDPSEKNAPTAFRRSFELGFGTETDLRDLRGEIVISHDPPVGEEMTLANLIDLLPNEELPLALNIKADGNGRKLLRQLNERGVGGWFTFDMSVPEMLTQLRLGIPVFTRASEFERNPVCYDQAVGVWLDSFGLEWYTMALVETYLRGGKKVCVVSPELHQRDRQALWAALKESSVVDDPGLMLCTDVPEEARTYFGRLCD